jgi:hypothetical protein
LVLRGCGGQCSEFVRRRNVTQPQYLRGATARPLLAPTFMRLIRAPRASATSSVGRALNPSIYKSMCRRQMRLSIHYGIHFRLLRVVEAYLLRFT